MKPATARRIPLSVFVEEVDIKEPLCRQETARKEDYFEQQTTVLYHRRR